MRRSDFLKFLGFSTASVAISKLRLSKLAYDEAGSSQLPNVVILLSDDLGYAELGCQGAKDLRTPNIDSLARDGIRCTNAYSSGPVCAPTRAGLMTGRYQNRFGYETYTGSVQRQIEEDLGVPTSEVFFSQIVQKAGYKTAMIGKWHLGHNEKYRPYQRGFDEFFGFLPGGHDYFNWNSEYDSTATGPIYRNSEPQNQPPRGKEYLTDIFSDEAVSFIERTHSRPFLLYVAYNAVHLPLQVPEKYIRDLPFNLSLERRKMIGMTQAMDAGIGRILAALRRNGLEKNTLVIFFSDNGGAEGIGSMSNSPLSGRKGELKEGGIRVPFIVKWTNKINAGLIYNKPIISLDIFPTVVAIAGQKLPEDREIDGVNLMPYLQGEKKTSPHEYLFFRHVRDYAVRRGRFKLHISGKDRKPRLYDLENDIAEKNDLSDKLPEVVNELKKALAKWESEMTPPQTERYILKSRLTYRDKDKK